MKFKWNKVTLSILRWLNIIHMIHVYRKLKRKLYQFSGEITLCQCKFDFRLVVVKCSSSISPLRFCVTKNSAVICRCIRVRQLSHVLQTLEHGFSLARGDLYRSIKCYWYFWLFVNVYFELQNIVWNYNVMYLGVYIHC